MSDSPQTPPIDWRDALAELVDAQTVMLTWYRDVHEPARREGEILHLEPDYDAHNSRVCDARRALLKVAAPDWHGLLIKLEQYGYMTGLATDDDSESAAGLLCRDLARLTESGGKTLTLALRSPHVGPNLSGLI